MFAWCSGLFQRLNTLATRWPVGAAQTRKGTAHRGPRFQLAWLVSIFVRVERHAITLLSFDRSENMSYQSVEWCLLFLLVFYEFFWWMWNSSPHGIFSDEVPLGMLWNVRRVWMNLLHSVSPFPHVCMWFRRCMWFISDEWDRMDVCWRWGCFRETVLGSWRTENLEVTEFLESQKAFLFWPLT